MMITRVVENEINGYLTKQVQISPGYYFSQWKLVKRIILFENKIYPSGRKDALGNYKYWFDIITPRIENEVKNVDFDTKNIIFYSDRPKDTTATLISNLALTEWMRETNQAEELNDSVEEFSGWGNVVWKKRIGRAHV